VQRSDEPDDEREPVHPGVPLEDEEEEEDVDEDVHGVGSHTPSLDNIEEEGSQSGNEDNNFGDDGERTSSSSQSSVSQRNTMDSLHNPKYYNQPPALSALFLQVLAQKEAKIILLRKKKNDNNSRR